MPFSIRRSSHVRCAGARRAAGPRGIPAPADGAWSPRRLRAPRPAAPDRATPPRARAAATPAAAGTSSSASRSATARRPLGAPGNEDEREGVGSLHLEHDRAPTASALDSASSALAAPHHHPPPATRSRSRRAAARQRAAPTATARRPGPGTAAASRSAASGASSGSWSALGSTGVDEIERGVMRAQPVADRIRRPRAAPDRARRGWPDRSPCTHENRGAAWTNDDHVHVVAARTRARLRRAR